MNKERETPSSEVILSCRDLHKSYKLPTHRVQVLQGLSLDVKRGESVAIMGASGAGKSTLLYLMGGLDRPDSGQVLYDGQDVYRLSAWRRSRWLANQIGFVFQSYHLLPELSVAENVTLPAMSLRGAMRNHVANEERALMLLKRVGLSDRAEHRPTELSGGEQQRVALARALMNRPDLIFADEPTGNLDAETGGQVLDYLFGLVKEQHQTLVMVTHNKDVAMRADRMVHLQNGAVVDGQ